MLKSTSQNVDANDLKSLSNQLRDTIIEVSMRTKTPHLGSALSCVDLLTVLYSSYLNANPKAPKNADRDRFILSKGHAALALYAVLSQGGFFSKDLLYTVGQPGSILEEHPNPHAIPGVDAATGSLGHGLSIGCGMALGAKINQQDYRVVVLLSDGECNEGSVWEAALFAATHSLSNLTVLIDANGWQATGRSSEVMKLEPLVDKWQSFGWAADEINGHAHQSILDWLHKDPMEKPRIAIARTVKGKGVSFMEDDNNWHYRIPNESEWLSAKNELGTV